MNENKIIGNKAEYAGGCNGATRETQQQLQKQRKYDYDDECDDDFDR